MLRSWWAGKRRKRLEPGAVEAELEAALREEIGERLGRYLKATW